MMQGSVDNACDYMELSVDAEFFFVSFSVPLPNKTDEQ
jgi:hypothetical protein